MTHQGMQTVERRRPSIDRETVRRAQIALVLTVAAGGAVAYVMSGAFRAEVELLSAILGRGDVAALRTYLLSFGAWAPVVSLLAMVGQALIAPIPAFLVVFANGLAFGTFWGWLLSVLGQMLAATVCFGIARSLGRAPVEALVGRLGLEAADRWFARWGVAGLFLTRLVPGVGFDGISYAAGLTRIGFATFAAATLAGSAPQLLLYAYLGQNATRYVWWLLAATVVVGVATGGAAWLGWRRQQGDRSLAMAPRQSGRAGRHRLGGECIG